MDPTFVIFAVLAIGLLFFMSSRTRKQQRTQADFRSTLTEGVEVMTASGMFGTIVEIDEESDVITLEAEPGGSRTRWLRAAISKRVDPPVELEPETDPEDVPVVGTAVVDAPVVDETGRPVDEQRLDVPDDLSGLEPQPGTADRDDDDPDQDRKNS
ncbi:preprotein translocase subunit YajC [Cellulomonas sp. PhB143]|uniref:preprotein translocase subunit YajC n=1 Tax=Cellulomonas sp. PhB143 TaxID=2485186 RepID=UPI000F4923F7|nr:preprotein translocase subunit YajC [Cellulomonas sp. PhB143]ROS74580.1 preprotein translocase subunit YajC [Cellulomonas sp. PhB143]